MSRMTLVQERNAECSRLLDIRVESIRQSLNYRLSQLDYFRRQILKHSNKDCSGCGKCSSEFPRKGLFRSKMDFKRHGMHMTHALEGSNESEKHERHKLNSDRFSFDHACECERADNLEQTQGTCHTHFHGLKRHAYGHGHHSTSSADFKVGSISGHFHEDPGLTNRQRSPEFKGQCSSRPDTGELSPRNTNLTAFLFSRHCRHGYVMKKPKDPTMETNELIKGKIRAKVVKNYLLQDVFKRLNSTKTLVAKNSMHDNEMDATDVHSLDSVEMLEQCRYLRVPQKKVCRGMEEGSKEDKQLTKVDVI